MTRRAVAFDRFATFLAGLSLVALGCCAVAWQTGVFGSTNSLLRLAFADDARRQWWPWAASALGIVFVAFGFRWLATHRWPRKAARVSLEPHASGLTADATSVANAAAAALESEAAIIKANGTTTVERGVPTMTLTVTVPARRGVSAPVESCAACSG